MKPSQIIKRAYKLIEHEENWTQVAMARRADSDYVPVNSPDAVRWCALGALLKAGDPGNPYCEARQALENDAHEHGHFTITEANDRSTHKAVLNAFKRVYKRLRAEGK
jgi:hypothetical protein